MAMDMRGSLNLSRFFKPGSNQPKYYGKAMINGVEHTLKGWEKVRQDTGEVWVSLLFESSEADDFEQCAPKKTSLFSTPDEPQPVKKPRTVQPTFTDLDDDIPF